MQTCDGLLIDLRCPNDMTAIKLYTFTGAGNNFVVLDGREADMSPYRQPARITELCRKYSTDGLMILSLPDAPGPDFVMDFFNPDGSGGMMCGNGGRCIVAFADYLGLKPASPDGTWHFLAPDGMHEAKILDRGIASGGTPFASLTPAPPTVCRSGDQASLSPSRHPAGPSPYPCPGVDMSSGGNTPVQKWTVCLKMIDVEGVTPVKDGYFLNTGTRHYVQFVKDVDSIDMEAEAKPIRWDAVFQPEGTNVNFVQVTPEGLKVRTYEKGVEGETLACGTGITASAIAARFAGIPDQGGDDGPGSDEAHHARPRPGISYRLQCRRGDWLTVKFTPIGLGYKDVYLTGPAELLPLNGNN